MTGRRKKNVILAIVSKEDPTRYHERTVEAEKGNGKKNRPREKININEAYLEYLDELKSEN